MTQHSNARPVLTDQMLIDSITEPAAVPPQDLDERLKIVQIMRTVLSEPASPALKAFIEKQLITTTNRQLAAFFRLLSSDNEGHRRVAEEGFRVLERRLQEERAHGGLIGDASSLLKKEPEAPAQLPVKSSVEPRAAHVTSESAAKRYLPFSIHDDQFQFVEIPESGEPNAPRTRYSFITDDMPAQHFRGQEIDQVAGVVIGIEGQRDIQHGFGFWIPLVKGSAPIKYDGTRNIIRVAMQLPHSIALYDDHRGPLLGGVSHFFTVMELMRDGYRFLLDLEIIPVNGRYALSMQRFVNIDRVINGQLQPVNAVHLNKLAYGTERLSFIAFAGEVEVS